jgi:Flp pilus assembly protein TadG
MRYTNALNRLSLKRRMERQEGASVVEFALSLLALLTILFGIIEFSIFIYNRQVITNASREGARAGIVARPVRMSNADIETVVRQYCDQYLVTFGSSKTVNVDLKPIYQIGMGNFDSQTQRCVTFGCTLEVSVRFDYTFLFLKTIGITTRNIQATSQMRME